MSKVGIFWVDPGVSTGVAWGTFDTRADTVAEAMRGRGGFGSTTLKTSRDCTIPEMITQADAIYQLWEAFQVESGHKVERLEFGMEDFILTSMYSKGKEGIFPAFLIGAIAVEMNDLAPEPILQTASMGMKYNTRKHLESWGCWVKGREHERAAWAHIGARLMTILR